MTTHVLSRLRGFGVTLFAGVTVFLFQTSSLFAHTGAASQYDKAANSASEYGQNASNAGDDSDDGNAASENAGQEDADGEFAKAPSPYNDPAAPVVAGNGVGVDGDGDTNPVTNTRAISRIGNAAAASFDPPYQVVTFEEQGAKHDQKLKNDFKDDYGVTFGDGVRRQLCKGQRYFQYNSHCTYRRAPSGKFAALYESEFGRPLSVAFDTPVCVAAMAIYPTGGKEGERYQVTLQGTDALGTALKPATTKFLWTKDTFRWRHMAGAYFMDKRAAKLEVSVKSLDRPKKNVRFLIDDVAFVTHSCEEVFNSEPAANGGA